VIFERIHSVGLTFLQADADARPRGAPAIPLPSALRPSSFGRMREISFTNLTRAVEIGANSYLIEIGGRRLILDSGLHPKLDGEAALPNYAAAPQDSADAIILSHAHQDHVGSLPVTMRLQPRAITFMTEATRQLSDVMLHNSVNVMTRKREEGVSSYPLFTHREIDLAMRRWQSAPLRQRFDLTGERTGADDYGDDVTCEFFDAGHILGSVGVLLRGGGRSLFYTGDVNFDDQTIMQGADFPDGPLDVLVMETTRGDRGLPENFSRDAEERRLAETMNEVFARGGGVLLPLFALGKTQELLAMFFAFRQRGLLRRDCPIYIGGLGAKLTEIHDKLAQQTRRQCPDLQLLDRVAPFVLAGQHATAQPVKGGRIYAISSGMMTPKTLSNTLAKHFLSDPQHSLIFVGYADPESPAGKIRNAAPGDIVQLSPELPPQPLRCRVEKFNFSGHASRESLRAFAQKTRPRKVILVHGEPASVAWFREMISEDLPETEVVTPTPGETLQL
jgi:Cft2 family RNA processing exonuclease